MKHEAGKRYYRGEIYYIHREPSYDNEQHSGRPAIIVSNDINNEFCNNVEVVYLTTKKKPQLPTHTTIYSTTRQSTALCESIFTVAKSRIGSFVNQISSAEMKRVDEALAVSLCIGSDIKPNSIVDRWGKEIEEGDFDIIESLENQESEDDILLTDTSSTSSEAELTVIPYSNNDSKAEEVKEVEPLTSTPVPTPIKVNIEDTPEYIRVCAERDTFKSLYMELLEKNMSK